MCWCEEWWDDVREELERREEEAAHDAPAGDSEGAGGPAAATAPAPRERAGADDPSSAD